MADAAPPSIFANTSFPTQRTKFIVGGVMILAAMAYLIVSGTFQSAQYFLTVDELLARQDGLVDRNVRLSGVVLGDTVDYDSETLTLRFSMADIPNSLAEVESGDGLAESLHRAASDPHPQTMEVIVTGQPKPDLLRHEAQAIVEGRLGEDGVFYADTLLLKCPTRYEEALPGQAAD